MVTATPLAGRTSIDLSLSLKVNTARICFPFRLGTQTRRNEVSSAKPSVARMKVTRRTEAILFTVLKVYRRQVGRAEVTRSRAFDFRNPLFPRRHPDRSRFSGGGKDLAWRLS